MNPLTNRQSVLVGVAVGAISSSLALGVGIGHWTAGVTSTCSGTQITTSSNVQSVIDTAATGTTFCFGSGTYHVSSLNPKSGDILDGGNQAAILDGQNSVAYAINSANSNVTVQNFVIQNYAGSIQRGALEVQNGSGWIISGNDVTHNAYVGIETGSGAQVIDNHLEYNGEEGYSCHGSGALYQGNEIDHNNPAFKVSPGFEAGGGKCSNTTNLTFRNNNSHDNNGPGLWDDINNVNVTYDGNTVTNNWGAGIFHEISYSAAITNNTVTGNGKGEHNGWLWDAGILIAASGGTGTTVSGNTLSGNYNGISLVQQNRGSGSQGVYLVQNVHVHDNTVGGGNTGAVQDDNDQGVFTRNNTFVADAYVNPNCSASNWWWVNTQTGFSGWQAHGLDTTGTCGAAPPPSPTPAATASPTPSPSGFTGICTETIVNGKVTGGSCA